MRNTDKTIGEEVICIIGNQALSSGVTIDPIHKIEI